MMFGCTNTAEKRIMKEKLLVENKKYFNSERASHILYEEAINYFKYDSFVHYRENSQLKYFVVLGDEPPYKIQKITKKQANKIALERDNSLIQIYLTKDNRIDALVGANAVSHYFDANNKKTLLKKVNDLYTINAFQEYGIFCHLRDEKKECYIREDGEDNIAYGQGFPLKYASKAFRNYTQYYNGKTVIYNTKSQLIKKINYKDKQITYFFYKKQNKYDITCDYKNETCRILF
jgi:hypothetical protein